MTIGRGLRASTPALVALLGACDAVFGLVPPDVPPPAHHDEDGDGIDDALDVCPGAADDQSDGDGDGVGDACDPHPAEPITGCATSPRSTPSRGGTSAAAARGWRATAC